MRNFSGKSGRENKNTYFMLSIFIFQKSFSLWNNVMWKSIVKLSRPQMTICRMRIRGWIPKATNIHSQKIIVTALQQWLRECAPMFRYRYIACLVCNNFSVVYIHFINVYFRQHTYIIKAWVKPNATYFDLKSHPQAKLRTMKFFTVWLRAFGIPDGLQFVLWFVSCT